MRQITLVGTLLLTSATMAVAVEPQTLDLKKAVPEDVYLVVYGRHNPERDYQKEHYAQVWKTFEETKIVEKIAKILSESVPQQELDQVQTVMEELRKAVDSIDLADLADAKEMVYAQRMSGFTNQQLAILRLGKAAEQWEQGLINLMELAEKYSEGKVPMQIDEVQGVRLTRLELPSEAQFVPVVGRVEGTLFIGSSSDFMQESISQMLGEGKSDKFEDPRLKEALAKLPEPEDALVFYDGRTQFSQLSQMGEFIRQMSGGNPEAERVAGLMDVIFSEFAILDYEVTVEYTEGNQNRTQAYGKLMPSIEEKMLYKAVASGKPFEDWQSWVPADALAYSLTSGIDLYPIYDELPKLITNHFPEAIEGLQQFEAMQEQIGVDIGRDILQSFSGECVSISLPPSVPSVLASPDSVFAMRCTNPEKIRELLHRGVEAIQQHPAAQMQQLRLVESEQIEGYEEFSAVILNAFGVRPAFGFTDGWMFIGSNTAAIQKVLDVRDGNADSMADNETFQQLAPDISGPVVSISYNNLGENIRNTSTMIGQGGAVAQMAIAFAGMQADAEELKPVRDFLGLLPDVGKIVAEFDFLEEQISVAQAVPDEPGAYVRKSVIQVRQPDPSDPDSEEGESKE